MTNEEICALVPDATPDWILSRTGIVTRRYAAADQATSDLAARAAGRALAAAGVTAGEVDYLIVSTSTGDSPQPPTACLVQDLIGARNAACLDINVVCSGFVYGLEIARGLLGVNPGTRALVIGADVYSRCLDYRDRRTSVLLGDGAGAVLVGSVPAPGGFGEICLSSYGDARDLIGVAAGGSRLPASASTVARGQHFFTMRGRDVRDFVLDNIPPLVDKLLSRAGLGLVDVGCFVPHQANGKLIGELARTVRPGRGADGPAWWNGTGTSAARRSRSRWTTRSGPALVAEGDVVLLAGFGGGMAAGVGLVRWSSGSLFGEVLMTVISRIGVVGAGQMGGGFAQVCARGGLDVAVACRDQAGLERARQRIGGSLDALVRKGKMTASEHAETAGRIRYGTGLDGLRDRQFVLEAIPERLPDKLDPVHRTGRRGARSGRHPGVEYLLAAAGPAGQRDSAPGPGHRRALL